MSTLEQLVATSLGNYGLYENYEEVLQKRCSGHRFRCNEQYRKWQSIASLTHAMRWALISVSLVIEVAGMDFIPRIVTKE